MVILTMHTIFILFIIATKTEIKASLTQVNIIVILCLEFLFS